MEAAEEGYATARSGWAAESTEAKVPISIPKPDTRSFWMILKLSSMVIINLIANLPFLYHKPEKLALTDPDHLKSAAEYLLQVARSSEGRRYRKRRRPTRFLNNPLAGFSRSNLRSNCASRGILRPRVGFSRPEGPDDHSITNF